MRPLAIWLLLLLTACGSKHEQPNVLLITIDTLRPDAVGEETPALRAFLAEATQFRRTRTVAPLTLPAHASMLTGLFPAHHGLHDNVTPPLPAAASRPFPLLAEQFRDAGYSTAAFIARAVLAPITGIASGFDVYDCPRSDEDRVNSDGYIPGEERVRGPIAWMEKPPKGKPWFVWVHLFDPHAPYHPFPGDATRAATHDGDPQKVLYHGEARRADAAFERLLKAVPKDTIVVLCSDHGEGLGEHGEPTHGSLCYSSTLDVLLAVRAPGFGKRVDNGLRSVADIAPTLRHLCGLKAVEGDGLDLGGQPHDTLVAESLVTYSVHLWGQNFAATDGDFTLIESGPDLELFDRRSDPGETSPLPLSNPAYEKLDRAMERMRSGPLVAYGGEALGSVSPYGTLRRSDIRYLPRHENAQLSATRPHMQAWLAIDGMLPTALQIAGARGDPAPLREVLRLLDDFDRESPGSPWTDHGRAVLYAMLSQLTGTGSYLRDAVRYELAAIEKGYCRKETIVAAITYIVDASDADALRTLIGLLRGHALDTESRNTLEAAKVTLGVRG